MWQVSGYNDVGSQARINNNMHHLAGRHPQDPRSPVAMQVCQGLSRTIRRWCKSSSGLNGQVKQNRYVGLGNDPLENELHAHDASYSTPAC